MPSAKEIRAATKRETRKWRPAREGAHRTDALIVAARECGQVLVTVPVKQSRFMPETETELKWLDSYTYYVPPSQAPVDERKPVDRAAYAAAQDPACAAVFGN